jgi:hypothetical protein
VQRRISKPRVGSLKVLALELGWAFTRWQEEASPLLAGQKSA